MQNWIHGANPTFQEIGQSIISSPGCCPLGLGIYTNSTSASLPTSQGKSMQGVVNCNMCLQHVQWPLVWWVQGLYLHNNRYPQSVATEFPTIISDFIWFRLFQMIPASPWMPWTQHWEVSTRWLLKAGMIWAKIRIDWIKRTQCFQDEVTIEPGEVIAVLAAATLLALEGLISQVMDFTRKW